MPHVWLKVKCGSVLKTWFRGCKTGKESKPKSYCRLMTVHHSWFKTHNTLQLMMNFATTLNKRLIII